MLMVVGGIWLVCACAALLVVIPMCRMAKHGDRADAAAVRAALEAGAAMEASVRAARADVAPGFVTDVAVGSPVAVPAPASGADVAVESPVSGEATGRSASVPGFVTSVGVEPALLASAGEPVRPAAPDVGELLFGADETAGARRAGRLERSRPA